RLTQERLEQVLAKIPTVTRAVLILRFRDGMGRKEVSQQLALTDRQVRRHLVKGYEYLRESFTELK
ncbi:sigma factor-like helix-turn-helix DNA-binding protein, partial [Steroidobacter sp.]|uniref:sigma factor-like helix-turn-helix DNA-binding protein n=1 Tax=Steroidobacter sp. TaxID=1978227 RepID=UPI001A543950